MQKSEKFGVLVNRFYSTHRGAWKVRLADSSYWFKYREDKGLWIDLSRWSDPEYIEELAVRMYERGLKLEGK